MKRYKHYTLLLAVLILTVAIIISCKKVNDQRVVVPKQEKALVSGTNSLAGSKAFCASTSGSKLATTPSLGYKSVAQKQIIYNTDYVSAGVGGMRDIGTGNITLGGLSGTVKTAYLYWHGVTNSLTDVGNSIMVNATAVTGKNIGVSSPNCWPYNNSQAYVADVTSLVQSTGNGTYNLSGFGDLNPNGASLIVFFNDANNSNNRDVVIFDGNDSNIGFDGITGNPNAPADPAGWNVLLSGINYTSCNANIQMHVADGQAFPDDAMLVNSQQLVPAGENFDGNSVPGANNGPTNNGNLWDIRTFDITSFLSPGPNTFNLTAGSSGDCLSLIVALIDLPAGAAPVTDIKVAFDFKPQGCPNPFNVNTKLIVTAAILGSANFDVSKIDVSTVKLNGVSPLLSGIVDVAAPFGGILTDCSSCTAAGPDGIKDLMLKFNSQALLTALGAITDGQCVKVLLTGKLLPTFGSTPITGEDKIIIIKK